MTGKYLFIFSFLYFIVLPFLTLQDKERKDSVYKNTASENTTKAYSKEPANMYTWEYLPASSEARNEGQGAVVNNKLYIFGGFNRFQNDVLKATAQNEVYDPDSRQWIQLTAMPLAVTHIHAVVVGKDIWIPGGFLGDNPGQATEKVQIYHTQSNTWSFGPDLPEKMASHAAVRIGNKLHVFGGLKPDRQTDNESHYALDLKNTSSGWLRLAPLPQPRNHLSAIVLKGMIYAIGGQTGHDLKYEDLPDVHAYDPISDSWAKKANLPGKRSHFETGTFSTGDGKIIVVGGRGYGGEAMKQITEYNPETDEWKELDPLPFGRFTPIARLISDELYVSGGGITWKEPQTTLIKTGFQRNKVKELNFSPKKMVLELNADLASKHQRKAFLFTLEGSANYQINQEDLPDWLQVIQKQGKTDSDASEIDLEVNLEGLIAGEYKTTLRAFADGFTEAQLEVQLKVARSPFRVLVFNRVRTDRQGFSHPSRQAGVDMIRNLGISNGQWATDQSDDPAVFTEANLSQYAVVVWCNTSGNELLNSSQQSAFEKFIRGNKGFVGVHAASDSYRDGSWPWYNRLVGAIVQNGPNHTAADHNNVMDVVSQHPTVAHLGSTWQKTEEYYYWQLNGGVFYEPGPGFVGNNVLLRVRQTNLGGVSQSYDAARPMSWYKFYEGGRSFYTALGHNSSDYTSDQNFSKHIEQAILWAASGDAVGVEDQTHWKAFSLSPNPSGQFIQIKCELQKVINSLKGTVYDQGGRVVRTFDMMKADPFQWQFEMDISNFSTGVYIVLLSDGKRQISRRLVKF